MTAPTVWVLRGAQCRYVIVDHVRARIAGKRGGGAQPISLEEGALPAPELAEDILAIDEALTRLEAHDGRLGRIVQLKFFAGLADTGVVQGQDVGVLQVGGRGDLGQKALGANDCCQFGLEDLDGDLPFVLEIFS